jgi:hypothetical protein
MKNDAAEYQALAAAQALGRFDMYTTIHKALRALMADTLLAVGRMDVDDDLDRARVCQRALDLLAFCRSHLEHENDFVHTALEACAPGTSARIAHEHDEHEAGIGDLQQRVGVLLAAPAGGRAAIALEVYRRLSLFVAHNFEHMNVEETAHNAVLWAHYDDAQLVAIHDALVASIPPDDMLFVLRWMVPFMNPAERAGMLGAMKAAAPAPAFQAALDTVRPHLTEREWTQLARALGLPPVPGLVEAL